MNIKKRHNISNDERLAVYVGYLAVHFMYPPNTHVARDDRIGYLGGTNHEEEVQRKINLTPASLP